MNIDGLVNLPGRDHYSSQRNYLRSGRIYSYASQIATTIDQSPANVLEVGTGPGIVAASLRAIGIKVVTLDMQKELEPDLIGSVTNIPASDNSFDVCLCCQVLEHLPFGQFGIAVKELRRVARNALVLSIPDGTPCYYFSAKLPKIPQFRWEFSRFRFRLPTIPTNRMESMGHFWEIGYKGSSLKHVKQIIKMNGWKMERSWRVPELVWHRFFLLK